MTFIIEKKIINTKLLISNSTITKNFFMKLDFLSILNVTFHQNPILHHRKWCRINEFKKCSIELNSIKSFEILEIDKFAF
jgi:hypothetical protein